MTASLEEQVAAEEQEHQDELAARRQAQETEPAPAADTEPADEPAADETALFDRSQYEREDLQIPKVDGQSIDRIAIKFSGTVFIDRSDPNDVALYNKLVLQRDVTLMVEGRCSGTGAKGATDRDGELDVIVGEKSVRVTTVYIPAIAEEKAA